MSADLLRRAAAAMRSDWAPWPEHSEDGCCDEINFHLAVADWLETTAGHWEDGARFGISASPDHPALAVARAYLGEET